jgi:hypothetical protein
LLLDFVYTKNHRQDLEQTASQVSANDRSIIGQVSSNWRIGWSIG